MRQAWVRAGAARRWTRPALRLFAPSRSHAPLLRRTPLDLGVDLGTRARGLVLSQAFSNASHSTPLWVEEVGSSDAITGALERRRDVS